MSISDLPETIRSLFTPDYELREELPPDIGLPPGCLLWTSPYAHTLACPVENPEHLGVVAQRAQEGLDALLVFAEQDSKGTVDGYLILILSGAPDTEALAEIRRLELNTSVCRKHVVWPENGGWPRLQTVTILKPPVIADGGGPIDWPETLATEEADFRDNLLTNGGKRLAELDMEGLGL